MKSIAKVVRFTVLATGLVYTVVLYISNIQLDTPTKRAIAYLPTIASLMVVGYEKWLWKLPLIRKTHTRPRLDGLWRATIEPDPDSHIPDGGNTGPIEAYVVIEQSLWSTAICLYTEESESHSMAASFVKRHDSSQQTLSFTYDNEPRRRHTNRSPRHIGACELYPSNGTPNSMRGKYYTDRFTAGEISLSLIDRSTNFSDFASAKSHADNL